MLKLKIEKREAGKDKLEEVRKQGSLPAVFYGPKEDTTPIFLNLPDFMKVWREAGESTVISLEGIGEEKEALIQEVAVHPVSDKPIHADFYVIEKGKKIEVEVPLVFVGTPPAVKDLGGTLVKVMHELPIQAFPKDLPNEIEVDVSGIEDFETHVTVSDISLPDGVDVLSEPEEAVALVSEPREEEEEEPVEFDESMVEVEGERKEDEGGVEGEEDPEASTGQESPAPEEKGSE